jgi:hypothetical protein
VEGQQIVVGGDILLAVQGFTTAGVDDRAKVVKALGIRTRVSASIPGG